MMMLLEGGIARKSRSRLIDNHSGTVLKALDAGLFPAAPKARRTNATFGGLSLFNRYNPRVDGANPDGGAFDPASP
jgi:hypothetical protein